jgi:hypothetical protein
MRKTLRISKGKILIYSPQHHGYYDPEDISGTTIYRYRPKKIKHKIKRHRTQGITKKRLR